jgi:hypothetical protein
MEGGNMLSSSVARALCAGLLAIPLVSSASVAVGGSFGDVREPPEPLTVFQEETPQQGPPGAGAFSGTAGGAPSIVAKYVGRADLIFDSTRLADFASGAFVPAAIPVRGEFFYNSGERATVQGNGSAITLSADVSPPSIGTIKAETRLLFTDISPTGVSAQFSQAFVQYNQLVVGAMETGFADYDAVVPTIDLAGPNGTATILGPTGSGGQGRLSYYFYLSGDPQQGFIANASIENPVPEIAFPSGGMTSTTTFATFSHLPDFVITMKYGDGVFIDKQYHEVWHLKFGTVLRELGLENGNKTIDDTAFGWGIQLSGGSELPFQPIECKRDFLGFSIIYGEGIGHYINDLHVVADMQKTGGNDAILHNGSLEVLPALAYYVGYLHHWDDDWQSSLLFSRVELDDVNGQVASAYQHGNYAGVNLVYHNKLNVKDPKTAPFTDVYIGAEYLYGEKAELSGNSGHDNRLLFMVNISK